MEDFLKNIISIIDSFREDAIKAKDDGVFPDEDLLEPEQVNDLSRESEKSKDSYSSSEQKDIFLQSVYSKLINIYKNFNYSLLSGEYISNSNIENDITLINTKISEVLNVSDLFSSFKLQNHISEFSSAVNIALSLYKTFIETIKNEYSEERVEHLFSYSNSFAQGTARQSLLPSDTKKLRTYFSENINLSILDHFFSSEDIQFKRLFKIEKNIDSLSIAEFNAITKAIKLKIQFLEHKWKIRKQETNPSPIHYIDEGEVTSLEDFKFKNKDLDYWCSLIIRHYEIFVNNWDYEIKKNTKSFINNELKDLRIIQIHQLIKYYKDVKKSYSKLTNISDYFLKKTDAKNFYDKYAQGVDSNYALNNKFSLFLESQQDVDLIKKEFEDVKQKTKGNNKNFFIEYKYLEKILQLINNHSKSLDNLDFLHKYQKWINVDCKEILDDYFTNKEWSKTKYNYIFVLPYEESKIDISDLGITKLPFIFISSSFVLPKINNDIENKYNEIRQKYKGLVFQMDSISRLKNDLEDVKELKNELDRRDIKSIEIISIFTAIITFVLSSIPAYKFIENVWQSFLFMISLASSLGVFVLLILFATRGFKKNWIGWVYFIIFLLLSTAGYGILINIERRDVVIDRDLSKDIDSITLKKVDSILSTKVNSPYKR